jgi:effector-binding domain-containing protein
MKAKAWIALLMGLITVASVANGQTTRWGYESAPYTVVEADGAFEIRDYSELVVVETADRNAGDRGGQSFNRLFRFISGHNEGGMKIPMTTPVYFTGGGEDRQMAFVLPSAITLEEAPKPRDAEVRLTTMPPARYAVMRFRGGRGERQEEEALARLRFWAKEHNHATLGDPVFGYFDPPWTPPFMRRNEVMLRLADPAAD